MTDTTPTLTSTLVRREVKIYVDVDGAEPLPKPYAANNARFRPTRMTVTYVKIDDGPWIVKGFSRTYAITFSGPVLRKDGTDGQNRYEERFSNPNPPAWAVAFAEANLPAPLAEETPVTT